MPTTPLSLAIQMSGCEAQILKDHFRLSIELPVATLQRIVDNVPGACETPRSLRIRPRFNQAVTVDIVQHPMAFVEEHATKAERRYVALWLQWWASKSDIGVAYPPLEVHQVFHRTWGHIAREGGCGEHIVAAGEDDSEQDGVTDGTGHGLMVRCPRPKPDFSDEGKRPQALKGVPLRVFRETPYPPITVDVAKRVCPICAASKIDTKVWSSVGSLKNHLNKVHGWSLQCPFCPRDKRVPSFKSLGAIRHHFKQKNENGDHTHPWDGEMDAYLLAHFEQSGTDRHRRDPEDGYDEDDDELYAMP
ncbi:hypothetical protein FN846DRAFT_886236 [Sphaerosporella brunnea]|uniref:Uncharacterized protein n=1 Tax=Sphaerosporella brunnea TaxID=1250544 RepID=A0A5J5F9B1_9PEZI|nr:hypothetical protein FN846DRAFT_886236 [Sphaerosporella brunnea]